MEMRGKFHYFYYFIAALGLSVAGLFLFLKFTGETKVEYEISGKSYRLLTAKNQREWTKGLSGLKELKDADGMIFIFPEKRSATFWNKDTHLDLLVYWIDGDQVVGTDYLPSIEKSKNIVEVISPQSVDRVAEIAAH